MLKVQNLYKRFNLEAGFFAREERYVYAVNGVSFTVGDQEIYGLVGESGCGKTTTARTIVQMYAPDAGSIHFTEQSGKTYDVQSLGRSELAALRGKIKYVFQDPARSLNPRMTILEILTAGYRYSPYWPGPKQALEEAKAVMVDVGLQASDLDRRPADFSGGQRQRISIARALMVKPELLICDEVVSALDVSIQGQILNLLLRLKEEYQLSMLFIAHDLAVVSYISDRIGVMYRGLMMEEATARELTARPLHPYTRHLYAAIPQITLQNEAARTATRRFREVPDPTRPPVEIDETIFERTSQSARLHANKRPSADVSAMLEVAPGHLVSPHFADPV